MATRGIRFGLRACAPLLALLLVAFGPARAWSDGEDQSLELAIKATFLYKFAPFVEWPDTAFASPSSPLWLCMIGQRPFGELLERAVRDKQVGGHPIAVLRFATVTGNPGCHIAYVSGTEAQSTDEILAVLQGTPVLTVTDDAQAGAANGIINFIITDNHVRFEIDTGAARQNGLTISSKLLSLAVRVK